MRIQIRIRILLKVLHMLENQHFFDIFSYLAMSVYFIFYISRQRHRIHNFQIFDSLIKFYGEK